MNNRKKSRQYPLRDTKELMEILLKDRTTNENIKWATDDYQDFNFNLTSDAEIDIDILTNGLRNYIQPRIKKDLNTQRIRTKEKAEVFTPTWIVKKQVDLVDKEFSDLTLNEYVSKNWLEITCGEAPYICTRYDMTTGIPLNLSQRVGFLDKKLQRINDEILDKREWLQLAEIAYKTTFGYEYQGDSLLIARENLLFTFIDYYIDKFNEEPDLDLLMNLANIISYNIIQMDGLNYTIPYSSTIKKKQQDLQLSLFDTVEQLQEENPDKEIINKKAKIIINNKEIYFEELTERKDNMKFDVVIGNPPYDDGSGQQIYTDFYTSSLAIANQSCLIFPVGWQQPKNANNLRKMNNKRIKRDKQIIKIINIKNAFPGFAGAFNTNIVHWKKGYNNELNGKQRIIDENKINIQILPVNREEIPKPQYINFVKSAVQKKGDFFSFQKVVSKLKPYGLRTDFIRQNEKYGLPKAKSTRESRTDIRLFTSRGFKYVSDDFPFPSKGLAFSQYKIFVPYAWGNWDEKSGLGGAFSDIFIAKPFDACLETYLECGSFDNEEEAMKMAKYMMTQFFRALLYVNKYSQHSTTAFGAIPIQDFSEDWWESSIEKINIKLFEKYDIPVEIMHKVIKNIQIKNEDNIKLL